MHIYFETKTKCHQTVFGVYLFKANQTWNQSFIERKICLQMKIQLSQNERKKFVPILQKSQPNRSQIRRIASQWQWKKQLKYLHLCVCIKQYENLTRKKKQLKTMRNLGKLIAKIGMCLVLKPILANLLVNFSFYPIYFQTSIIFHLWVCVFLCFVCLLSVWMPNNACVVIHKFKDRSRKLLK